MTERRIISTQEEFDKLKIEMKAKGLRLAAMSNTGLPKGQVRVTFLPESSFKKPS